MSMKISGCFGMIGIERFILRDDRWERVKHLLPGKETDRGVMAKDNRLFLKRCCGLLALGHHGGTAAVLWELE